MASSSSSPFDDLPLDPTKRMFRLWRFKPRASNDELHLELASFTDTCPFYIALSYTWGDTSPTNKRSVKVNRGHLSITANLWDFLLVLEHDRAYRDQWFWADQICINQTGTGEQNHQVSLMGEIYSTASVVFAWLGAAKELGSFDLSGIAWGARDIMKNKNTEYWLTLLHICTREYWKRLWIVQELKLAQKVILWCRSQQIEPQDLLNQLNWISVRSGRRSFVQRVSQLSHPLMKSAAPSLRPYRTTADTIEQFNDVFQTRIRALLKNDSSAMNRRQGLVDLLATYANSECTDIRDKVFGLQSLAVPTERIPIDYSIKMKDLAVQALKAMVLSLTTEPNPYNGLWFTHKYENAYTMERITQIEKVMKSLDKRSTHARMHCWAYFIPRISGDLRALDRRSHVMVQPWSSWTYLWEAVRDLATTSRQMRFADDIWNKALARTREVEVASTFEPGNTDRIKHWPWYGGVVRQAQIAFESIAQVAVSHGFVMFGDFMFHPDDNHFCEEESSTVVDYLIRDAMRGESALE